MKKTKIKRTGNSGNEVRQADKSSKDKFANKFSSREINLNFNQKENDFYNAVIEFYGVDTTGPSYEGRVFLNNPEANEDTPLNEANGYVGSYHIFGHDGCWGDEGHCEAPIRSAYDSRLHTSLTPAYKYIDATKAIKKFIKSRSKEKNCTITIIPRVGRGQRMSGATDVVRMDRIRINCYENALKSI
jgi:hypothetical protein